MIALRRFAVCALDWLGFVFAELAFRTDCRVPFAYRLGCWFYARASAINDRHGLGLHKWVPVEWEPGE